MKRVLFILLTAALMIALSACASGAKTTPAPAQEPTAAPAEPTAIPAEPTAAPAEPTAVPAEPTDEPAAEKEASAPEASAGPARKTIEEIAEDLKKANAEQMFESTAFITIDTEGKNIWTAPLAGIKEFKVPESFLNAKGGIRLTDGSEVIEGSGLVWTNFDYMASTKEDYYDLVELINEAWYSDDSADDGSELYEVWNMMKAPLFTVYGINKNRGEAEIKKVLIDYYVGDNDEDAEELTKAYNEDMSQWVFTPAGSVEDFNFFIVQVPAIELYIYDEDQTGYTEEYLSLREKTAELIPLFTFDLPYGLAEFVEVGTGISFETSDLNGNPIKSAELFGKQKVTMVNLWGTFCGYCISEMPELVQMNKEFEAKGAQIVGIVYDATSEDLIQEAKDIIDDINIDFINLLPNDTILDIFKAQSFPCSYFVNDKGEVLGEPVLGANLDKYKTLVDEYLAAAN